MPCSNCRLSVLTPSEQSPQNSVQAALQLNLTEPLAKQLRMSRSTAVANRMSELRRDFVSRNYQMVMAYRRDPSVDVDLQIMSAPGQSRSGVCDQYVLKATVTRDGQPVAGVPVYLEIKKAVQQIEGEQGHHVVVEYMGSVTNAQGKLSCALTDSEAEKVIVRATVATAPVVLPDPSINPQERKRI